MKTYKVRYTLHNEKKVRSRKIKAETGLDAFRKIERNNGSAKVVLPIKIVRR